MLIPNKIGFNQKKIMRQRRISHIPKRFSTARDIVVVNIYTPNNSPWKSGKQTWMELKGHIYSSCNSRDFDFRLSVVGRTTRQRLNEERQDLEGKQP